MRLELDDIIEGGLKQELTCAASEFTGLIEMGLEAEVGFVAPIQFQLRLQRLGQLVEVDGQLSSRVTLACGRCLQACEEDLSASFAFTFTPYVAEEQVAEDEDVEVELDTDELGLVYYQDECLDLMQPLQDQLVMALPISPICSDQCKGLCPECGCNLNIDKCQCEKKVFNNRFSALAGLEIESSEK